MTDFATQGQVEALAERYQLMLPDAIRSPRAGERAGRRAGSSVEFQDRKDFSPGDDLRHVDWRGYARSDRMTVKLYREEIMPQIDIIVDGSASMEVTPRKRLRQLEVTYLFWLLARKLHARVSCWWVTGKAPLQLAHPLDVLSQKVSQFENPLPSVRGSALSRPGGIRVFLSDLLFPFEPSELENTLGRCDCLMVVQLLSAFEANPGANLNKGAILRLTNAEANDYLDVRLTEETVSHYSGRLAALQGDLRRRLEIRGGAFTELIDDETMDDMARKLYKAGMIAP